MSASTQSKKGNSASTHGTGRPACAISASRPTVLMVIVLPPLFGPLMSGGAPQLVQQHQRIGGGLGQDVPHAAHVRGKRAEALLNGLLIADVGQHAVEE